MSKPEHSPLPKCVITGRIAGDQFACGDCDPCIKGAFIVPQEVQDLLAERDEFASKYENAEVRYDDNKEEIEDLKREIQIKEDAFEAWMVEHAEAKSAIKELVEALERTKENLHEIEAGDMSTYEAQDQLDALIAKHKAVKP